MIGGVLARTAAAEGVRARSVTGAMQATICSVTLAHAEAASTWLGGNCNGAAWRTSALACARHARAQPDAAPAQHERQQNACASPAAPLKFAAPLPSGGEEGKEANRMRSRKKRKRNERREDTPSPRDLELLRLSRSNSFPAVGERGSRRVEGMPKFDLDELLSFEEVRLRAAHICELTRVHRPCVSILRAPQPTVA